MNPNNRKIKIAVLDLNNGFANQGMRCISHIISDWSLQNKYDVKTDIFDVRQNLAIPDLTYDVYISSGGPGSPLESAGHQWDNKYMQWIDDVNHFNQYYNNYPKKHVFFICHSFQLACRHFHIANVCKRKSTSFGVFPIHMTKNGADEIVFSGMKDPFFAVDSRDYQVIKADEKRIEEIGAKILAIEKERPHVPHLPRAIMAVRFNDYMIGTQFHPEADPKGMTIHLHSEEKKQTVINNHGEEKWKSMIEQLNDPDKILWTHDHILPNFLNIAVEDLVDAS
ncbi:MAG: GMP synthase [Bacteroidetes bacterium]|nr:GMP synthase [Bacteroidota bacterium]